MCFAIISYEFYINAFSSAVSSLIGRNADYLVHATSVHLRHAPTSNSQHAEAIQVLGAVMSHGNEEVCHLMKDCIQDLLVALDTRQLAPPLVWAGLQTLARSCGCWISRRERVEREGPVGVVSAAEEEEEAGDREDVGIEAIAEYFLQYHKNRDQEAEGGGVGQEEEQGAGQQEEESYSQDCPLPAVEQLCVEVMRRCGHHMSHDSPSVRLVVMETLEYCMQALQHEKVIYSEVSIIIARNFQGQNLIFSLRTAKFSKNSVTTGEAYVDLRPSGFMH